MPNNDLFSGIPSLDDTQGLDDLLTQQSLDAMGVGSQVPSALEQIVEPAQQTEPAQQPQVQQQQQPQQEPTGYTSEQIAQLIARNQQLEARFQQQQVAQQQQQQQNPVGYSDQQKRIINELLNRGVPIERIAAALNKNRQSNAVQTATLQKLQQIEQYLQAQEYQKAQTEFVNKMTAFGDKFGLSEDDLVYFGELANSKGINVIQATDLESVFRAILPEQYALRLQRINNNPTSQIYGGVNVNDIPRATASKAEDAYVDAFMRQSMPNQYGMHKK